MSYFRLSIFDAYLFQLFDGHLFTSKYLNGGEEKSGKTILDTKRRKVEFLTTTRSLFPTFRSTFLVEDLVISRDINDFQRAARL